MSLFKVVLSSEVIVVARDEEDAMTQAESCQHDIASAGEFYAESSEQVFKIKDLPVGWNKDCIPWNANERIETLLKSS